MARVSNSYVHVSLEENLGSSDMEIVCYMEKSILLYHCLTILSLLFLNNKTANVITYYKYDALLEYMYLWSGFATTMAELFQGSVLRTVGIRWDSTESIMAEFGFTTYLFRERRF